jgi:carbon-monoxide dehydrogenase large subunit
VDAAIKSAKHVTKLDIVNNRLVPNAMEPRVAIGDYDSGTQNFHALEHVAEPASRRLVIAAFVGMAPEHKLRVIAPDCGRRLRLEDFHLSRRGRLPLGREEGRPSGEMDLRPFRGVSSPTAHGRDHVTHAEMAFGEDGKITGLKVKTIANLGAYMSTFSSSVPTYLYATLLSGQYDIPAIYCEVDAVYTNTVPVEPIAAPAGRRRPSWSSVWSRSAPASWARTRRSAQEELHQVVPAPDAGDHGL